MFSSKFLTLFKWLLVIRLIFGHYYYSGKSKILKILLLSYCFLFSIFCCIFFYKTIDVTFEILVKYYYTEFIFNCIISLLFRSNYVNGIISLVVISSNSLNASHIAVPFKLFGTMLILLLIRVFFYVYFGSDVGYFVAFSLSFTLLFSMFLSYISKILFFDVLLQSMRILRKAFEYKYVEVNIIGKDRIKHRIKNIKTCLSVYDDLLQLVENMDLGLEIWLFFTVLIYFPKAVLLMRNAMMLILNKQLLTFQTFWAVLTLIFTISVGTWPMILFELTKNEVDIIKDILFKQSLMDIDEMLRLETQHALQHISLRPCQYRVCRIMPMGICLTLSFISLCITYVIVLVQFSPDK